MNRISLFLSLLLLSTPVALCAADLERTLEQLDEGDYASAIEGFKTILETTSDDLRARRGWADALVATGRNKEAIDVLTKHPDHEKSAPVLSRLGRVYLGMGRLKEARAAFETARSLDGSSAETLFFLGESLRLTGELEKAREVYESSIAAYQDLDYDAAEKLPAESFVNWGRALIALNRYKDAQDTMFSQAAEKDEYNGYLLLHQGRMFIDKYNFPDSRACYRDAIDLNPNFADALAELADNYITDFQVGTKRFDQAEKYIDRALKVNPRHAGAHTVRGRIWLADGYFAKAISELKKALEENPASLKARGLLGASYFVQGDEDSFQELEKETLAINPRAAQFYHEIALAIERQFRYPHAVKLCDRALALDPDFWPAYVTLGINCLRTGENARGRRFLEKSWEKDHYNVWVFNTRTLLRHMDRNFTSFENDRFVYFLPSADAPSLRPYMEPLLDGFHKEMSERYKVEIDGPIQIECFSKHKWFSARTVGLEGFAASGACFGKLVTLTSAKALPQNWGAVARHEFAHVVAIQLTDFRVPRWLTEGISVYEEGLENPKWKRVFQREIADAWGSGRLLPLAELNYGFSKPKFPMQILLSYYQGCLIVQYIEGKWGFDAVLKILDGYGEHKQTAVIFKEVLGEDVDEFDRGFFAFVKHWVESNGYFPFYFAETIPRLELNREKDPEDVRVLCDLAWAYLSNGKDLDAMITAGKARDIDPKSGDAHAIIGMMRLKDGKVRAAREELEKAREVGTRFAFRVNEILGDILVKERNTRPKAIRLWEDAKKISPIAGASFPPGRNIYYKLAKYYEEEGDSEKAIQQMEELSNFAPEDGECRWRVAKYALEKDDAERAVKYLEELLYINPFGRDVHRLLAAMAEKLGHHETVIREIRILLTDPDTDTLNAHLSLARAHLALGQKKEAAAEAKKVLGIEPENTDAREILQKLDS